MQKFKASLMAAFAALAITACGTADLSSKLPSQDMTTALADPFISDVIDVKAKHIDVEYWIKPGMDRVIMSEDDIRAFNAKNIAADPTLYDLTAFPQSLSDQELTTRIRSISKIPSFKRIYTDGTLLTDIDFDGYEASLNLDAIAADNPIRWALVVRRTHLRTYPTDTPIFSHDADNRDIDRFQESVLFPGDAVAVLHISEDGRWALVQSYNYIAWARLEDMAFGDRDEVLGYRKTDNFLLIAGDKVRTVYNPEDSRVSELQLDMGVKLPLVRPEKYASNLYGQNPYLSHMVRLPVREPDGSLNFRLALIQRNADVNIGYLPYTEENIIRQAFKFAGERYGWGHRYNGRDCTGFVSEVYKSFGIVLPRNSGDQGKSKIGVTARFDDQSSLDSKVQRLDEGRPGDLVYIPGHVLMLLGHSDGQPFAIHDVTGLGYLKPDGSFYKGTLNGVSITPVLPLRSSEERSYMDMVYAVKALR